MNRRLGRGRGAGLRDLQPAAAPADGIGFDYKMPPYFVMGRQGDSITFTPVHVDEKTPCVYGLGPSRRSTGSLADAAAAALREPRPGWTRKGTQTTVRTGVSSDGWPYYWVRAAVGRRVDGRDESAMVMAMAFGGGKGRDVHVVWGTDAHASCTFEDEHFMRLFHSLHPRGWSSDGGRALLGALVGTWQKREPAPEAYIVRYRFAADGRYTHGSSTLDDQDMVGRYFVRDGQLVKTIDNRPVRKTELETHVRVYDELAQGRRRRVLAFYFKHHRPPEAQYDRVTP